MVHRLSAHAAAVEDPTTPKRPRQPLRWPIPPLNGVVMFNGATKFRGHVTPSASQSTCMLPATHTLSTASLDDFVVRYRL